MDKFISSYDNQRKIFLADTDSYTIIISGFTEKELIYKIKIATLLYDNVFIPAAYMWQSEQMREVMYKIQSLILTENVLPIIRKSKETRDIKDYFEKRQSETNIVKNLEVYKIPVLSSEIATKENERDMNFLNDLNVCLHLEGKSVKDEFIALWKKDLTNSTDIYSLSMILYQSNIDMVNYNLIISCLKNDLDYEHFSRSVLIDYILSLDIDDRIKEKLQERTSWLYLKANANASDSDFYLSRNMSSVHVYKANIRMYSELLKNFGINESMIMSLTCEEIIRIKNSPEYLKFISSYVQIVNDIYFEQQDIMEKANKKINTTLKNERIKRNVFREVASVMEKSEAIFIGLIINYFSSGAISKEALILSGGISAVSLIMKKINIINKLLEKTAFVDFKDYILKEQYKNRMNQCINRVLL